MTRQRKYQIKHATEGLCMYCSLPKVTSMYCLKHAVSIREMKRKYHSCKVRYNSLTYKLEKEVKMRDSTKVWLYFAFVLIFSLGIMVGVQAGKWQGWDEGYQFALKQIYHGNIDTVRINKQAVKIVRKDWRGAEYGQ